MEDQDDKIIMCSLHEEMEQLDRILRDPDKDFVSDPVGYLKARIAVWANDLLMNASENEPGAVHILPAPPLLEDPDSESMPEAEKDFEERESVIKQGPYSKLGAGTDCME